MDEHTATNLIPGPDTIRNRAVDVAGRVFGWKELRPGQLDAIEATVNGSDVLVVMATGYGKSAVYQIAGHLIPGPTVVISPLISLQIDQVRHIKSMSGSAEAVAVNSAQSNAANIHSWAAIQSAEAEFIFLAPEQLARPSVVASLKHLNVGLVVVDEAHSVSSWGHDFRPDYLRLGETINQIGRPPILALTATGSSPVRTEIIERLQMSDPKLFVGGFDRPNIHLSVHRHESDDEKIRAVIDEVLEMPKPGLVYVATRKQSEDLAGRLQNKGIRASAYSGGLGSGARRDRQEAFMTDHYDVVVATSAFGMGIDKPNVRFVVHADITDSIDSYYQEMGRAGRDATPARAVLHYRQEDLAVRRFFTASRPNHTHVDTLFRSLSNAGVSQTMASLVGTTGLSLHAVENIVNDLVETGLAQESIDGVSLVEGRSNPAQARASVAALGERRVRIDQSRLAMVRAYAETLACKRQFLLNYFGDSLAQPCGNCGTCDSGSSYRQPAALRTRRSEYLRGQVVQHHVWGQGEVVDIGTDRLTVFFQSEGYRVLSLAAVSDGTLLIPAAK